MKKFVWGSASCSVSLLLVGIAIGVLFVWLSYSNHKHEVRREKHLFLSSSSSLTNPLLECSDLPESISIGDRKRLEDNVESMMDKAKSKGIVTEASVYYRDLNNGPWFGVNESLHFNPGSLLKVPLAITVFQKAEDNPTFLTEMYKAENSTSFIDSEQPFSDFPGLLNGKMYSVSDLVQTMLEESSNEAAIELYRIAGAGNVLKVYKDFGFTEPEAGQDYSIDTHTFSSFFRTLYNSTYLNRSSSEKLLNILTETKFKEGLVAGVPKGVLVAHKYGVRTVDESNTKQLHDCGIIYVPDNPYVLCVMTQGENLQSMAGFIKDVSAAVYKEVK